MKRLILLFFFVLLPCTAQVRWLPDETVRTSAGGSTDIKMGFNNTHIVAAIGTTRYMVWIRADSLLMSSSEGGLIGSPWRSATLIVRGNTSMNLPTLAATSDGKLCVGWNEVTGVKTMTSSDGGKTWTTAQTLASRGGGLCLAAGQNGVLYALWHSGDETSSDMMFATWQNGAWSPARAIDTAPATNAALWGSLCVVGSSIYAVWRENTTGQFRIYLTRSKNGGATWDAPRNIITEDRSGDPSVAESSGQLVVAYQRAQQIYTVISGDDGATFNAPKLMGNGLFARIVCNQNGFFALVWERFTGNNAQNDAVKQVGFAYSTDYGYTYSTDTTISGTGAKLALVQFTGSNEITASWFNTTAPGAIVAKRAALTNTVSVRLAELHNFSIFPNPAQNLVRVSVYLKEPSPLTISLVNLLGQEVVRFPAEWTAAGDFSRQIDVANLPQGAYLLRLQSGISFAIKPIHILK
jgi:hypothetical protein